MGSHLPNSYSTNASLKPASLRALGCHSKLVSPAMQTRSPCLGRPRCAARPARARAPAPRPRASAEGAEVPPVKAPPKWPHRVVSDTFDEDDHAPNDPIDMDDGERSSLFPLSAAALGRNSGEF